MLTMVFWVNRYYSEAFRGFSGVTQRDPFYPTIFNLSMDAVVLNCVWIVAGGLGDPDQWGKEVLHHSA